MDTNALRPSRPHALLLVNVLAAAAGWVVTAGFTDWSVLLELQNVAGGVAILTGVVGAWLTRRA